GLPHPRAALPPAARRQALNDAAAPARSISAEQCATPCPRAASPQNGSRDKPRLLGNGRRMRKAAPRAKPSRCGGRAGGHGPARGGSRTKPACRARLASIALLAKSILLEQVRL